MARAIWSGSISFGLVNVPVKLKPAVHQNDLKFHQFEEGTNSRVHIKRVSEKTGKEVPYERIVKGYELSKGHWVMVDPDELAKLRPRTTKTVEIEDFVALEDIDPIYYDKSYYLVPDGGEAVEKAYALLRQAMEDQGKVAIGRLVMRTKQYLAAIRPAGRALVLSTLLFHDDVVPEKDLGDLPSRVKVPDKQARMAGQLIESLTAGWKPQRYSDTYKKQVLEMIKAKAKGKEIVAEAEAPEEAPADLMAALEASLAAAKASRKTKPKAAARKRRAS